MTTGRVFRVTIRGRFGELTDEARRFLVGSAEEHDIFRSEFSPEGTFTYDSRIDFFNLRYEVRATDTDDAHERAVAEAERFLKTLRITHRGLRATSMDMSAMWDGQPR